MIADYIKENYTEYRHYRQNNSSVYFIESKFDFKNETITLRLFQNETQIDLSYKNESLEYDTSTKDFDIKNFNFKKIYENIAYEIIGDESWKDYEDDKKLQTVKTFLDGIEKDFNKYQLNRRLHDELKVNQTKEKKLKI